MTAAATHPPRRAPLRRQPLSVHAWLRWDAVSRLLPSGCESVLEVGAGLGSMGAMLATRYDYVGLEPDAVSQAEADRRTMGRVRRERVEDHAGVYDLVCAFEVLEHLRGDVVALRGWRDRSRRWLLLSVPMNPRRYGASDEYAGHYRRYTAETLSARLVEAGWQPRALRAYGFPLGYGLEAVRNVVAARRMKASSMGERTRASGRWLQPPQAAAALTCAAALPFRLAQRPFADTSLGTGLVALAERSDATR
jgi:hypothetical protein